MGGRIVLLKVLSIISIIIAILVVAFAIWGLIDIIMHGLYDWRALIFIGYLIFFGTMVILLELKAHQFFLENFGFMRKFAGKGFFFIFLGLIAFNVTIYQLGMFHYYFGGFVILFGIFLIIMHFVVQKDVQYQLIK